MVSWARTNDNEVLDLDTGEAVGWIEPNGENESWMAVSGPIKDHYTEYDRWEAGTETQAAEQVYLNRNNRTLYGYCDLHDE